MMEVTPFGVAGRWRKKWEKGAKVRQAVALLMVLGFVAAGCKSGASGGKSENSSSAAPVSLSGQTNKHGIKDLSGTSNPSIEIEQDDSYFGPTFIKADPGATVKVELKNDGKNQHTFTIDELKIDEALSPEGTKDLTFTLPSSGVVRFYCRFHQDQGMQGAFYFTEGASNGGTQTGQSPTPQPGY